MFFCGLCKIVKQTFLIEHLPSTASVFCSSRELLCRRFDHVIQLNFFWTNLIKKVKGNVFVRPFALERLSFHSF